MTKNSAARVHHAVATKASKNGVELKEVKKGFTAIHADSTKKATAPTAKEALDKVLKLVSKSEESDDEEGEGLVVVKEKYKKKYAPHGGNCGDGLAETLTTYRKRSGKSSEVAFVNVCRENKIEPNRWAETKNNGLKWMALSNVLRRRIRKQEAVSIDGVSVTEL